MPVLTTDFDNPFTLSVGAFTAPLLVESKFRLPVFTMQPALERPNSAGRDSTTRHSGGRGQIRSLGSARLPTGSFASGESFLRCPHLHTDVADAGAVVPHGDASHGFSRGGG
ncbi:hypothetical protein HPB50_023213 [Hyalomma asiaticum]|uniref:Uncharacterized protein n=1 Tax=Hyalomma asiaticum TaxID=266040 RepID=A0ACB7SNN3_HYAAI|nr:hypothetical protein HPB50_023213 [Hyalomma asiaticum]